MSSSYSGGLHNGDLELNWFLLRQKPQFFILVLTMEDLFYILMSGLKTKLEHWKYFELLTEEKRRHKYESFMCSIMMLSRGRAPPWAPPGDRHFWNILFFGSLFLQYGAENMHMTSDLYTAERYTMKANIIMRELSTQLTMFQILKAWVIKEKLYWYLKFLQPSYFKYESERKYWYKIPVVWDFICIL